MAKSIVCAHNGMVKIRTPPVCKEKAGKKREERNLRLTLDTDLTQ